MGSHTRVMSGGERGQLMFPGMKEIHCDGVGGGTNKKWIGHSVPKGRGPWGQLQTLEQSPVCSRNLKLPTN